MDTLITIRFIKIRNKHKTFYKRRDNKSILIHIKY